MSVKSFLVIQLSTFMVWRAFECVMKRPYGMWVFFPHFSCLAWICHMQADCLYHCLKRRITDSPTDSMSLDATLFSVSSKVLLQCQEAGSPVQAGFEWHFTVIEGSKILFKNRSNMQQIHQHLIKWTVTVRELGRPGLLSSCLALLDNVYCFILPLDVV